MKVKVARKHRLHGDIFSLDFIEDVQITPFLLNVELTLNNISIKGIVSISKF